VSTKGVIGMQGLKTSGNELAFPPGSLTAAANCMFAAPGVIQPRRGQPLWPNFIDNDPGNGNNNQAEELWQWLTHLFISYFGSGGFALSLYENLSTYHALGAFSPPEPALMRMKFAALAQSAYFTTDTGLKSIDKPANSVLPAGVQRPTDFFSSDADAGLGTRLIGNPNASGSWLSTNNAVAYHAVIGRKDGNGVVKLSGPTGRLVMVNPADLVIALGSVVLAANVVTVTLAAGQTHDFRTGDIVSASSTDGAIGVGPYTLLSVTPTTFTYAKTAANHTSSAAVTYSSGFKSVQLLIGLTSEVQAGWFVQVYRTDESGGASIDPGDECFQCYERTLSATDVSNGLVTITDTTPSAFLGEPLPTNANTGDGPAAGANDKPPMLRDICVWNGKLFGIQLYDRHRLAFRLLGCGSPNGLQNLDVIAINTRVFFAGDHTTGGYDFDLFVSGLPSQNILKTCQSFVSLAVMPGCISRFEYDGTSPTGEILVDEVGLGGSGFADASSGAIDGIYAATTRPSAFADPLATLKAITSASTSRTSNVVTVHCVGHGFTQGQKVMLAYSKNIGADTNFPPGFKTVSQVVDANNFKYAEVGANATLSGTYYAYATTFKSDAGVQCVRFSKDGEPDAWPLPNVLGGLPDGASPLRIKPTATGNALMVFLQNGDVFRVSGQYPYVVRRFDGTATLISADSLQEHNGQLYGLTTQGVVSIGEGGVGIVGRDIEDDLRALILAIEAGTVSPVDVFGLSYESDRQYQLWDANTVKAYVLNSLDGSWNVGFDGLAAPFVARNCGLVLRGGDYMLFGDSSNQLRKESKVFGAPLWQSFADDVTTTHASGAQVGVTTLNTADLLTSLVSVGDAVLVGGGYQLVTAVSGSTFTVASPVTVANGDVITFYRQYVTSMSFAMESAGIPGVEKMFRELQLHFAHRSFSKLLVSFSNEKSNTPVVVTVAPDDFAIATPVTRLTTMRIDVPNDLRRSALLKVTLTLSGGLSYFRLLGYSATAEASSERTGK
jgi:hypothetical protein